MKDLFAKHRDAIINYCKVNSISKLSLFGTFLKNSNSRKSDIDLLVEFDKGAKIGLLDMSRMERELSDLLDMKVDLRTPNELSRYFRDTVIKEAEVKYEA